MIRLRGWCARRPRGAAVPAGPAGLRRASGGPAGRALRVLVDMDGVLADFEGGFLRKFRARFPDQPFIALEDRRGFWVSEQYDRLQPGLSEKAISIWESENFFFDLEPLPGAVEAVKQMANLERCAPRSGTAGSYAESKLLSKQLHHFTFPVAMSEGSNFSRALAMVFFFFFFLSFAVRGPLTVVASPAAEHRLRTRRLSGHGSRAQPPRGTWDPPRPGHEPASPASAGGLSTTAPPGKPAMVFLIPAILVGVK
ncbi:5'(3')-deoxyribonucleotidase, mitochondrial isoform X1 [Tursiops truncatus]|uniref:5'(3')-deoxyribonucleotidase, mitochondrial isoform X1 n=1 Tax=Tursiops truncatus TaxID=9739 RepID=UPI003CCF66AD